MLRYAAHDAVQRPDGSFAYRVRAKLNDKTNHRVGLKGTAELSGEWVTIGYWMSRARSPPFAKRSGGKVGWPQLREELALYPGPQLYDGQPSRTLHDPVRNQFFRLN